MRVNEIKRVYHSVRVPMLEDESNFEKDRILENESFKSMDKQECDNIS